LTSRTRREVFFGKKIELFIEDSEMKPDVGLRKAKKLIIENKVQFLSVQSDEALAIALNRLIPEYKVSNLRCPL